MGLLSSLLWGRGEGGYWSVKMQCLSQARRVLGRGLRVGTLRVWALGYALIFCNTLCESLFSDTSCLGLVVDMLLGETVARLRCLLT